MKVINPCDIGFLLNDGAIPPIGHIGHDVVKILKVYPKCCESDVSNGVRIACSCGQELETNSHFIVDFEYGDFLLSRNRKKSER